MVLTNCDNIRSKALIDYIYLLINLKKKFF